MTELKKAKGVTVVVDVFRAFTVEAYIMNGGAQKIIPVGDIDFAYKYKKEHPEVILTGSLANSKAVAEYIKSILLDKQ